MGALKKNLLLATAAVLAILLVLEAAARWLIPERPDPVIPFRAASLLGYRTKPELSHSFPVHGGETITWITNARGFRGREPAEPRDPERLRIVVLGDSVAFGYFNGEEATIAALLQEELSGAGTPAEVLNAGVPGYASLQALILLQTEVLGWEPDLVFLFVGWNDLALSFEPDWHPSRVLQLAPAGGTGPAERSIRHHVDQILRKLSSLYGFLRDRRIRSTGPGDGRRSLPAAEADLFEAPPEVINSDALAFYGSNLESMAAICSSRGIDLIIATWPSSAGVPVEGEARNRLARWLRGYKVTLPSVIAGWREYTEVIRAMAGQEGVALLDLERIFGGIDDRGRYFVDPVHLRDEGNRIIARAIARKIAGEGVGVGGRNRDRLDTGSLPPGAGSRTGAGQHRHR